MWISSVNTVYTIKLNTLIASCLWLNKFEIIRINCLLDLQVTKFYMMLFKYSTVVVNKTSISDECKKHSYFTLTPFISNSMVVF